MNVYDRLKTGFEELIESNGWENEGIRVQVRTLSPDEAIGRPEDQDYPIIKGRERMMEAEFHGARGQAFTDMPGGFSGTLKQIAEMELESNYARAVFLACLNAVMRHAGSVEGTVHCRDDAPPRCAAELAGYIEEKYGRPRIAMIGLQPRMVQVLAGRFEVRVTDLDEDNIGRDKFGVVIGGPDRTLDNIAWCDVALVTGSTLANATIMDVLSAKPTIYFGVTAAGPAVMLELERFCPLGS
ncbi:MAG: hypothetical protein KKB20_20315 [Proteobacteria bacterium]|nr:hypothetical protein [Pseudomonadota bacterium]